MGDKSAIQWTDATWNPIVGCSKVSPGCANCYAETLALRWGWTPKPWVPENAAENVILKPERLDQPLHWRKPRRIFVNSLSDLFHDLVPDEFIDQVFAVMALAPQHTFQVLTKRPERMREYVPTSLGRVADTIVRMRRERGDNGVVVPLSHVRPGAAWWPLSNVWLGTSVENARWRTRIDELRQTPAVVRFLSCEPLLGPLVTVERLESPTDPGFVDYRKRGMNLTGIDWVIIGGESGAGARPMEDDWVRDIISECRRQNVAPFVKQLGDAWSRANLGRGGHGGDIETFPEDLRVREYPNEGLPPITPANPYGLPMSYERPRRLPDPTLEL